MPSLGPQGRQQQGSPGRGSLGGGAGSAVLGQPGPGSNTQGNLPCCGHRHSPEPKPSTSGESAGPSAELSRIKPGAQRRLLMTWGACP